MTSATSSSSSISSRASLRWSSSSPATTGGGSLGDDGLTNGDVEPNSSGLTFDEGLVGALKEGRTLAYTLDKGWTIDEDGLLRRDRKGLMERVRRLGQRSPGGGGHRV